MINIAVSGGRVIVHIAIIKRRGGEAQFCCNGHIKGTGGDIIIIILPPSSFPLFLPHGSSVSLLLYILSPAIADWGKAPFYSAGQPLTFLCPSGRAKTDSRRRQRDCAVEMMTNLLSSLPFFILRTQGTTTTSTISFYDSRMEYHLPLQQDRGQI